MGDGRGGRCKLHGGMSTGPKTETGKRRALEALKRYRLDQKS
ncbi:MAG: HGGxSTG domain-containing protein [Thiomonas sp.]